MPPPDDPFDLQRFVEAMNAHATGDASRILGEIDALKYRSCVALFAKVAEPGSPFHAALAKFSSGSPRAFHFRPLAEPDLPLLREWLLRPHVAEWWNRDWTIEALREHYLDHADEPRATRAWIACLGPEPIGFIQRYWVMGSGDGWWVDETDPGAVGIDLFLADGHRLGQGLGSAMIRAFLEMLFESDSVTGVQTDPSPGNARAIAAYRKAGFGEGGLVATPDGPAMLLRCDRASFAANRAGPPARLR